MASPSPDKGPTPSSVESEALENHQVMQPTKAETFRGLDLFIEEINRISETAAGQASEQWSGSGTTAVAQTGSAQTGTSWRDQAIANLPPTAVMQKQLEQHIRMEVKKLRKEANRIARIGKPGGAYHLNNLYSRIRHLNALLAELLEAGYDVLKRLFIRIFIDRQTIL